LIVCIDSSVLVSLYVQDANSLQAAQRMSARPEVWLTSLNQSGLAHAVFRYAFRGAISEFEARAAWQRFERDCANGTWTFTGFPDVAWTRTIELARKHGPSFGMRTLDSLHVACALELRADRFWTFDERQARLAEAAGLDTRA